MRQGMDKRMVRKRYDTPGSLLEAEERLQVLLSSRQRIQLQLGDKSRRDLAGLKMEMPEYFQWRTKAIFNLNQIDEELRFLRNFIRNNKRASYELDLLTRIYHGLKTNNPEILNELTNYLIAQGAINGEDDNTTLDHPEEGR